MKSLTRIKYKFAKIFKVHQSFVVVLIVLLILLAVIFRVNMLNNLPTDQNYLKTESAKIKIVNFNEDAIEEIKSLSDSNVSSPGTQLPKDRQNPFNE